MIRTLTRMSMGRRSKKPLGDEDYDLSGEERKTWEREQLSQAIDLDDIGVDPAPFQLVEHSSLFKVHSLFSLLGLNRAYVTDCGKLVGVVALRDVSFRLCTSLFFSCAWPSSVLRTDFCLRTASPSTRSKSTQAGGRSPKT